jgi:LmbE family N-acetylglucosaminyl deacetylase
VPYSAATFPGHPYTGESLEHDFDVLLDRVQPTLVLAPSPRDLHDDHRATALLVMRAMSRRNALPQLRYWIVHGGESWLWLSGYQPDRPAALPPRARGLAPLALQLQPVEERRKLLALRAYQTQLAVMSALLLSYVRTTEIYYSTPLPQSVHERQHD